MEANREFLSGFDHERRKVVMPLLIAMKVSLVAL